MRIIYADDFFRTFPELDVAPYNNFPTVENERPKGEWIYHTAGYTSFHTCSRCNGFGYPNDNFCNHCGADMRKGGAE